jgi:hypothetical protein
MIWRIADSELASGLVLAESLGRFVANKPN